MSLKSTSKPQFVNLRQPLSYLDWSSRNWELLQIKKPDIYELKIDLVYTKPTISRTILIPEDVSLNKLHLAIQRSFNWWNYHLFRFDGYGTARKIESVFTKQDQVMYEYDFGTTQYHLITKVKVYKFTDKNQVFPVCVEAKRFAPFEDSSDWDYMLEIAQDPKHDEYKETMDWLKHMWKGTIDSKDKFSVSKLLAKKVDLYLINHKLADLQLYPTKEYKQFNIPTSMDAVMKKFNRK